MDMMKPTDLKRYKTSSSMGLLHSASLSMFPKNIVRSTGDKYYGSGLFRNLVRRYPGVI